MKDVPGTRTVEVRTLSEALEFLSKEFTRNQELLFRGHASHNWKLTSSLYRRSYQLAFNYEYKKLRNKWDHEEAASLAAISAEPLFDTPPEYDLSLEKFARAIQRIGDESLFRTGKEYLVAFEKLRFDPRLDWSSPALFAANQARILLRNLNGLIDIDRDVLSTRDRWSVARNEVASLAQHYGMPTHLIDFTESAVTAAFFAAEMPVEDAHPTIISIDMNAAQAAQEKWIDGVKAKILDLAGELSWARMTNEHCLMAVGELERTHDSAFTDFMLGYRFRTVGDCHVANQHQRHQSGVLFATHSAHSFEALLDVWEPEEVVLTRVVVTHENHEELMVRCRALGTTPATAYGGLKGAAENARLILCERLLDQHCSRESSKT